jgi:hypothetical protein
MMHIDCSNTSFIMLIFMSDNECEGAATVAETWLFFARGPAEFCTAQFTGTFIPHLGYAITINGRIN